MHSSVHVRTNTCRAVRCASSLQSVLHEILTVIIKTWIVRAHACLRRCVHDLAQYDKGHRLVCSRCSTTPFAAQAPLSLYTRTFSFHVAVRRIRDEFYGSARAKRERKSTTGLIFLTKHIHSAAQIKRKTLVQSWERENFKPFLQDNFINSSNCYIIICSSLRTKLVLSTLF